MTASLAAAHPKSGQLAGIGHWLTTIPSQIMLTVHDLQVHVTPPPMASAVFALAVAIAAAIVLKMLGSALRPRKA